MIEVQFHAKSSVRMRSAQLRDAKSLAPLDEYRITIWEDVGPYEGLPDSVRHTFTREQLLALKRVVDGALEGAWA